MSKLFEMVKIVLGGSKFDYREYVAMTTTQFVKQLKKNIGE